MTRKILDNVLLCMLGMISIGLIYVTILMIYPYKPLEVLENPLIVRNKTLYAGDNLYVEFHYKKNTEQMGTVRRALINDYIISLPPIEGITKKGVGKKTLIIPIPYLIAPGKYKVIFTAEYKVNFVRTVRIKFETEEFSVFLW